MYFGLIRPVQEQLNIHLINSIFDKVLKSNEDLIIEPIQDDIIIESKKDLFIDARVSIPFGAYYFLVLFQDLLFPTLGYGKKNLSYWYLVHLFYLR